MNRLTVVTGLDFSLSTEEKHRICLENGIQSKAEIENDTIDRMDANQQKKQMDFIISRVKKAKQTSAVVFTNSDIAIQWLNNAVLLGRIQDERLGEEVGICSLPEDQVKMYEYNSDNQVLQQIVITEYGFEVRAITESLNDLFETTLKIQDKLE